MKNIFLFPLICALAWLGCKKADGQAPIVEITNPADAATVFGTVIVAVSAADDNEVERVELYIADSLVASFTAPPYTYPWITDSLPDSSLCDIYAKAYDAAENEGVSATNTVLVYNGSPARILIWNFDEYDTFYDPEAGATIDCTFWLKRALTLNGYLYSEVTFLPADLDSFDIVFVTLGWYRC